MTPAAKAEAWVKVAIASLDFANSRAEIDLWEADNAQAIAQVIDTALA
jgi:hypothetical protein